LKPKVAYLSGFTGFEISRVTSYAPKEFEVELVRPGLSEDELVEHSKDWDFLIVQAAVVPARLLREAPKLKLVQATSQGFDRIPIEVAAERKIPVANNGGANAIAVAEHSVMLMMVVLRQLFTMVDVIKNRADRYGEEKTRLRQFCHGLNGRTVGVVGLGAQGKHVSKILNGFGSEVIAVSKHKIPQTVAQELHIREVTFDELIKTSDVVSLHVPLDDSTRGLMGRAQFNMMKPSAILVNCSRGGVVDEPALIEALQQGKIAGAGLDVFWKEPPKSDNPLLSMPNVVATPHMAGYCQEQEENRIKQVWDNIERVWNGQKPLSVVNGV
jgi:phosphoglycerate dehydrogenase-like enzyme